MRLRVLSDLHLEFHQDSGKSFVDSLDPSGCDALILAGDISNGAGITKALTMLCERFESARVVFVPGNHEFYGSSWDRTQAAILACQSESFHHLSLKRQHHSVSFVGATLWFGKTKADKSQMNDFRQIKRFGEWVYKENDKAKEFLNREVQEGDIVVTHYLPSFKCVDPLYAGSPLNGFFVCPMDRLIEDRKPKLWVHGHTHSSVDMMIGSTRIVCNPFGYVGHEVNPKFDPMFTVEV